MIEFENKWKDMTFEEDGHLYTRKDIKFRSVTTAIKDFHAPFPFEKASYYKAKSLSKKEGRYISPIEVQGMWREKGKVARELGTKVHNFAENFTGCKFDLAKKDFYKLLPTVPEELAAMQFWMDLDEKYIPVALEMKMYLASLKLAGTGDVILYNTETEKFIIADYKTNADLFKDYNNKLYDPFGDMKASPYNKYVIQLSFYQWMMEDVGYEVEERWLVSLKPHGDGKLYKTFKTESVVDKLKEHYELKDDRGTHISDPDNTQDTH